jgi:hypothetical protein
MKIPPKRLANFNSLHLPNVLQRYGHSRPMILTHVAFYTIMACHDNLSNNPDPPTRSSPDDEQWHRSGMYHPHLFSPCTLLISSPRASSSRLHPLLLVSNTTMILLSKDPSLPFPSSQNGPTTAQPSYLSIHLVWREYINWHEY